MYELNDRRFDDLTTHELYDLLRLRNQVFIVEQDCAYLDIDGRDTAPNVRHIWFSAQRQIVAACRMFDEGRERVIGRIVTDEDHRGNRLAAKLLEHCLATSDGPWRLAAQAHLATWYERFGFAVAGEPYDEDGIAHIDMVRPDDD